jgi:hypothetical protein
MGYHSNLKENNSSTVHVPVPLPFPYYDSKTTTRCNPYMVLLFLFNKDIGGTTVSMTG